MPTYKFSKDQKYTVSCAICGKETKSGRKTKTYCPDCRQAKIKTYRYPQKSRANPETFGAHITGIDATVSELDRHFLTGFVGRTLNMGVIKQCADEGWANGLRGTYRGTQWQVIGREVVYANL